MTVVVGVAAPDGLILGAESRTSFMFENGRHRIISDSAQKLFPICETIGVATYGDAFIGQRTIAGLMDEFVSQLDDGVPREAEPLAVALGAFFDERFRADWPEEYVTYCEQQGMYPLGFLIAGYDSDGIGRIRELGIPGPFANDPGINTANLGVCWRGQTDVIRRLVKGFDGDLFAQLGHVIPEELEDPIAGLEYALRFPITMQDAVDFASFLIRTTIDMQRFSDGTLAAPGSVPGCGGQIQVLSATRNGTEWVSVATLTADRTPGTAEEGRPARW